MAQSHRALARAGLISPKASLAVLRGTKVQKSKMASFNSTERDEASPHKKAEVPSSEINHPTNQRDRARSMPSRGGAAGRGGQPTRGQIDQEQGPMYPAGSKVRSSGKKVVGVHGGSKQNYRGNSYGAPNSRP